VTIPDPLASAAAAVADRGTTAAAVADRGTTAGTVADRETAAGGVTLAASPLATPGDAGPSPAARIELREGLAWAALGAAILYLSVRMDRLADQGVPPYAAPGLVPGLLGIAMILFGGLVAMRVRQKRAEGGGAAVEEQERRPELRPGRLALVIGLCLTFSVVLIGHGMPFWIAASLFVTVSILVLQHPERQAAGRGLDARALIVAAVIGVSAGGAATLVFQRLFLVHLP
jgi:hypothetical protein